jgi:hypothetical protein
MRKLTNGVGQWESLRATCHLESRSGPGTRFLFPDRPLVLCTLILRAPPTKRHGKIAQWSRLSRRSLQIDDLIESKNEIEDGEVIFGAKERRD